MLPGSLSSIYNREPNTALNISIGLSDMSLQTQNLVKKAFLVICLLAGKSEHKDKIQSVRNIRACHQLEQI